MATYTIGVRDLKNGATQVMRTVREERADYIVTLHGRPVAVIRPFVPGDEALLRASLVEAHLAELAALAEEIGAAWQCEKSGVELVADQRRG